MVGVFFSPFYPTKKHVPALSEMLARSFLDNPIYHVLLPSKAKRHKSLHVLSNFMTTFTLKYGITIATSEALEGALLALDWEKGGITTWRMLASGGLRLLFSLGTDFVHRQEMTSRVLEEMHASLTPPVHTYLWNLGVNPAHQGEGLGGKLVRYLLSTCSDKHRPCYLETAKPENVELYKHLGFHVIGTREITGTGITATGMLWE